MSALAAASQRLGEKVYADVQAQASAPGAPTRSQEPGKTGQDDDVIDAEFREVNTKR
ncbi:hypothetical protein PPGU19_100630 (plasmid) [Paraburkholderia sp. PGU19]|nr:hypothetical protein PPGU19_100630 [Paraburkholderia sp. PGU19]